MNGKDYDIDEFIIHLKAKKCVKNKRQWKEKN
jgi:hypothetical protein